MLIKIPSEYLQPRSNQYARTWNISGVVAEEKLRFLVMCDSGSYLDKKRLMMTVLAVPCSPIKSTAWKTWAVDMQQFEWETMLMELEKASWLEIFHDWRSFSHLALLVDGLNKEVCAHVIYVGHQDGAIIWCWIWRIDILFYTRAPVDPPT